MKELKKEREKREREHGCIKGNEQRKDGERKIMEKERKKEGNMDGWK